MTLVNVIKVNKADINFIHFLCSHTHTQKKICCGDDLLILIEKIQITHKGFHTPNFVSLSVNKTTNCCFVFAAYDVKTIKQQGL